MSGLSYGNRVGHFSTSRPQAIVTNAFLNTPTLAARVIGNAKSFNRKSMLHDIEVTARTQGQWIAGGERLNSAAEDVTIQIEFSRSMYTSPIVDLLTEAMPRQYDNDVDFDTFDYQSAYNQVLQDMSTAAYGFGAGNIMLGLGAIVDDGTNVDSYGGQSRTTYDQLAATYTDWVAAMSLSKLATMHDAVSDSGINEMPTSIFSDFSKFSLYESLLTPTVSHEYSVEPVRGRNAKTSSKELSMGQGFTSLRYRGIPWMRDKACTANTVFMLNENYLDFYGDTKMPKRHAGAYEKISLGKKTIDGFDQPSEFNGFFFRKEMQSYDQLALTGRFVVSGQFYSKNPRRHGQAYNVTSV